MRFALLGVLEVRESGRVLDLGRGKQRALLAILLLHANEPVSSDELIEALWPQRLPLHAEKSLQTSASRLRAVIGRDRLVTTSGGYRLQVAPGELDAEEFLRLARRGSQLVADGDARLGEATLVEGLTLWRGPALADVRFATFAQWYVRELEDARAAARADLAEAWIALGRAGDALRELDALIAIDPYWERVRRLQMLGLYRAGRQTEALAVFQETRRLLGEELGLEPGPELRELERAILQHDPALSRPSARRVSRPTGTVALIAGLICLVAAAALIAVPLLTGRGNRVATKVIPGSLVEINRRTLKVTRVVPIGDAPDLVVASGGYLWVTHHIFRSANSGALRNAGDRTLTRVDPRTGVAVVVGGGLAPCGLAADPAGAVWVADCYPAETGSRDNVIRIDARTLAFTTWPVSGGDGFFRGLSYGGGSLWFSQIEGGDLQNRNGVTRLDPRTGSQHLVELARPASDLSWSEENGDIWIDNFTDGSLTRLHAATNKAEVINGVATSPTAALIAANAVWVGDWMSGEVVRVSLNGNAQPRTIPLPSAGGVTGLAAGGGAIWAATPGALWRINEHTDEVTQIKLPYVPTGVAAAGNAIWTSVRKY